MKSIEQYKANLKWMEGFQVPRQDGESEVLYYARVSALLTVAQDSIDGILELYKKLYGGYVPEQLPDPCNCSQPFKSIYLNQCVNCGGRFP